MDMLSAQERLLKRVACILEAQAGRVERFDTHISTILVAGEYAYKFKRALRLPFLDFSTPGARRFYCEEECRLNRRLAPALYLGTVPITGDIAHPVIGGEGEALDFAVWMRAFDQGALWSARLARGLLDAGDVDLLAARLAQFHATTARAPEHTSWGTADRIGNTFGATLDALERDVVHDEGDARAAFLRRWETEKRAALAAVFADRKSAGMVRECHGDLHCSNILSMDGAVQVFDCIEFDAGLRWIDVMDDLAFAYMDLAFHGRPDLAARLLNAYLEYGADYAGLAVFQYYEVHRALVRARVMFLRARQSGLAVAARDACRRAGMDYVGFACRCARARQPALIITHGCSGSGKTTVARMLVELLGAVQLRSDVERKRLGGVSGAKAGRDPYGEAETHETYERLAQLARGVLLAGWPVVVDASFLLAAQRARCRMLADSLGVPFHIVDLRADRAAMLARIAVRRQAGKDASEADATVLEGQLRRAQALDQHELAHTVVIDTAGAGGLAQVQAACAEAFAGAARREGFSLSRISGISSGAR